MNRERRDLEDEAYCLCFHVRPATCFIGFIHLTSALLYAIMLMLNYDGYERPLDYRQIKATDGDSIVMLRKTHIHPTVIHRSTTILMSIVSNLMMATISAILLYGVVKSRASYLMPFFGIQLFDFFFSLPTYVTFFYTVTNGQSPTIYARTHLDGSSELIGTNSGNGTTTTRMSSTSTHAFTLLIFTSYMLYKAYFIGVVWKCYRYLKMKEMILPLHFNYRQPVDVTLHSTVYVPTVNSSVAPPDYDTATKSCPPPDYETALQAVSNSKPSHHQQGASVQSGTVGVNSSIPSVPQQPSSNNEPNCTKTS